MTDADEALLWARERAAKWQDEGGGLAGPSYRSGNLDGLLRVEVEGYRAGAAASAERIKELEAALDQIYDLLSDAMQADCENGVRSLNEAAAANYLNDFPHTKKALDAVQFVCAWNLWAQPGKPDQ